MKNNNTNSQSKTLKLTKLKITKLSNPQSIEGGNFHSRVAPKCTVTKG